MKVYVLTEGGGYPGDERIIVSIHKTMNSAMFAKAEYEATPRTLYDGSIKYWMANDIEEWELKE